MGRQAQRGLGRCDGGIEQAAQHGAGVRRVGVGIGHGRFAEGQMAGLCDEPVSGMAVPVNRSPQFTSMSSRMRSNKALLVASLMAGTPAQPKAEPRPVVKQMICALVGVGARQHGGVHERPDCFGRRPTRRRGRCRPDGPRPCRAPRRLERFPRRHSPGPRACRVRALGPGGAIGHRGHHGFRAVRSPACPSAPDFLRSARTRSGKN